MENKRYVAVLRHAQNNKPSGKDPKSWPLSTEGNRAATQVGMNLRGILMGPNPSGRAPMVNIRYDGKYYRCLETAERIQAELAKQDDVDPSESDHTLPGRPKSPNTQSPNSNLFGEQDDDPMSDFSGFDSTHLPSQITLKPKSSGDIWRRSLGLVSGAYTGKATELNVFVYRMRLAGGRGGREGLPDFYKQYIKTHLPASEQLATLDSESAYTRFWVFTLNSKGLEKVNQWPYH